MVAFNKQNWVKCVSACALVWAGLTAHGDDWPQHLGINQDATSAEDGLLEDWLDDGPPELWRHDVGLGFAGTAIYDGRAFLNDRNQAAGDILRVFDLDSGKELWRFTIDAPGRVNFPGSRSTPSVTDTHVYLSGPIGHITAVNRKTRKADWAFNIFDRYPDNNKMFGYGPSPVVVDDVLLISPTANGSPVVVAVDPQTGDTKWQSTEKINNQHMHHTPVIRTIAGKRGIACRDRDNLFFIDIDSGKTIWSVKTYGVKSGPHVTIPPVTVIGNKQQYVFTTNGYEDGSILFEVSEDAKVVERYRIFEGAQIHPAIYFDKHLYANINDSSNLRGRNKTGGLACIDPQTGEVKWNTANEPNFNRGGLTLADGMLYAFDDDTGELMLIRPNPEKFELIAKFEAIKPRGRSNHAWSPIVISDGRLVIRDQQQIVCFDLRQNK